MPKGLAVTRVGSHWSFQSAVAALSLSALCLGHYTESQSGTGSLGLRSGRRRRVIPSKRVARLSGLSEEDTLALARPDDAF